VAWNLNKVSEVCHLIIGSGKFGSVHYQTAGFQSPQSLRYKIQANGHIPRKVFPIDSENLYTSLKAIAYVAVCMVNGHSVDVDSY
jgi:hypothetical protein